MVTIIFLITIIFNTALGTIPLLGPVISGVFTGLLAGTRDLAMAIAFWGAIIGGALCRVFLNYTGNTWHYHLLNIFGKTIAHYTEIVVRGNLFFLALYFGLAGISGAFIGAFLKNKIKNT
jgi:hypothetical protein